MSGLKRKPERLFFIGQFVRLRRQGNWRFRPFRFLRGKRGLRRLSDGFFQIIFAHVPAVIDRAKGFDEIKPKLRVANISLIPRIRSVLNGAVDVRSEEHTSELQSLMRISYAVFCLKKKTKTAKATNTIADNNIYTITNN